MLNYLFHEPLYSLNQFVGIAYNLIIASKNILLYEITL